MKAHPNTSPGALRTEIEAIAAASRAHEAAALKAVIEYTASGLHKSLDGFSGIRDWIKESFDFNYTVAGQLASIARLSPKYRILTEAALSGEARIDAVAYAIRRIEREGLFVYSRVPFKNGPVESPYDTSMMCETPEELIREYCAHAPFGELSDHLDRLCAQLLEERSLLDDLSEQTLQWFELSERPDGMWDVEGRLTRDTGKLFSNFLKTAVPPPRQEEADSDGLLPRASNRNAEALHQLVAAHGTDPSAPKRHGHTASLNLSVDIDTLRGEDTGRLPMLEGRPVSVAKARLLACEAGIIPSVFDYATGEAIELGRSERLPNTALRRKLELEQPTGCIWSGCNAPIEWTEAHHVVHWADGGETVAENLILLCRFHHGRIHTKMWSIEKTGPGAATITHLRSGCSDADWEEDLFSHELPTGLDTEEYSPAHRQELDTLAAGTAWQAMKQAQATVRGRFEESPPRTDESDSLEQAPPLIMGELHSSRDPIPFLLGPSGRPLGERTIRQRSPNLISAVGPSPVSAHRRRAPADRPGALPTSLRSRLA